MSENNNPTVLGRFALPLAVLLAGVMISATLLYTNRVFQTEDSTANIGGDPTAPLKIELTTEDHVLGDAKAPVTIVAYSDFQCPFCRRFWEDSFVQLKAEYINTGKVRYIHRHYPLDFHPAAIPSAVAVECAAEQGKFWELHDQLFAEQAKRGSNTIEYGVAEIKQWAAALGLNNPAFVQCLASDQYQARIQADLASGSQYQVDGTPTAFVNGQRIVGAQPYAVFKAAIESALK